MGISNKTWIVYIIQTKSGALYTGITTDLERRFYEHQNSKKAKFFRVSPPLKIIYCEVCSNRSKASQREAEIKKLKRDDKLKLVSSSVPLA